MYDWYVSPLDSRTGHSWAGKGTSKDGERSSHSQRTRGRTELNPFPHIDSSSKEIFKLGLNNAAGRIGRSRSNYGAKENGEG